LEEEYFSHIPPKLPIDIKTNVLCTLLEQATHHLAQLDASTVPDIHLFWYMHIRKEAVLSSQIEGTQSSLSDLILFENRQKTKATDTAEVSCCVEALDYGIERLKSGFPLCIRLIKEMHAILLHNTRGKECLPGEVRTSQNWIGGTRPGNAAFVPPEPEILAECLSNLEQYIHMENIPTLIKAAVAHLQFETIHPFLDGNGRIGRLLIILILYNSGLLKNPLLYPSLYFKENRHTYYALLNEVRTRGNWEDWIEFFLKGIAEVSERAISAISQITALFNDCDKKISGTGRQKFSVQEAFEHLKKSPFTTATTLAEKLKTSVPTARTALNTLVDLKIIESENIDRKSKHYIFHKYLHVLDTGE
jgi:Fic family protein